MEKSKLISIRLPVWLYEDLKKITTNYSKMTMSKLIIFATAKDIQRYKDTTINGKDN